MLMPMSYLMVVLTLIVMFLPMTLLILNDMLM